MGLELVVHWLERFIGSDVGATFQVSYLAAAHHDVAVSAPWLHKIAKTAEDLRAYRRGGGGGAGAVPAPEPLRGAWPSSRRSFGTGPGRYRSNSTDLFIPTPLIPTFFFYLLRMSVVAERAEYLA